MKIFILYCNSPAVEEMKQPSLEIRTVSPHFPNSLCYSAQFESQYNFSLTEVRIMGLANFFVKLANKPGGIDYHYPGSIYIYRPLPIAIREVWISPEVI